MNDLTIAGVSVAPGERARIEIPVVRRVTHAEISIPVTVMRGKRDGPRLFVCAAIHGDEINGVEIIRRLLKRKILRKLKGTLITVPVVNVHGFVSRSRYLPDRRDLNRSFPGSRRGSLAGRVAHAFMTEIVAQSTHGIDLHTGANHRTNLPQIRACLDGGETERLAKAFGAPVVIDANTKDGSLRQAVLEMGIPMLLYEAGEALRYDELAIKAGVKGTLNVMRAVGMLPRVKPNPQAKKPRIFVAAGSTWTRAPDSGILLEGAPLGAEVKKGERLGVITDPMGEHRMTVKARTSGVIIGRVLVPLVNEGDPLFHIAGFDEPGPVAESVEEFTETFLPTDDD